jgi:hypothetical protein
MQKLVYPLIAILCFYASSNCYAQTTAEMTDATSQYRKFMSYCPTLKTNLDASLKQAKAAQKNSNSKFDNTRYKAFKDTLQEQYRDNGLPVINLQKKYPVVRNIGTKDSKDLEKWKNEIEPKYAELNRLVVSIDTIVKTLKPSQLTSNWGPENLPVAARCLARHRVDQPSEYDDHV